MASETSSMYLRHGDISARRPGWARGYSAGESPSPAMISVSGRGTSKSSGTERLSSWPNLRGEFVAGCTSRVVGSSHAFAINAGSLRSRTLSTARRRSSTVTPWFSQPAAPSAYSATALRCRRHQHRLPCLLRRRPREIGLRVLLSIRSDIATRTGVILRDRNRRRHRC